MNFLTKLGRFAMFVLVVLAGAVLSLVWAELAGGVIFALVVGLFSKSLAETLLHSQIAILATGYITILCGWLIRRAGKRKCDIDDEIKTVSDIKILKPPPRTASME